MAKTSPPYDGTTIEANVRVVYDAPHGVVLAWVPAFWNEQESKWVFDFTPDPAKTGGRVDYHHGSFNWRPLGQTARIEAKQKSVGKDWVITNGDSEFMAKDGYYWVMPRGEPSAFDGAPQRTWPMPVKAIDVYDPADPNALLIGHYWDGEWPNGDKGRKERAAVFTIKASQVWAVRKYEPIKGPNVAEPRIYEALEA